MVAAVGASGGALLVAPGSTERSFSWTLRPPAAAALIGGFYLASAVVFAWGLTLPRRQARALLVGVLGIAVPTLVLTIVHDEVFDFDRWPAVAWVRVSVTAPVSASVLLVLLRSAEPGGVCRRGAEPASPPSASPSPRWPSSSSARSTSSGSRHVRRRLGLVPASPRRRPPPGDEGRVAFVTLAAAAVGAALAVSARGRRPPPAYGLCSWARGSSAW